MVKEKPMILLIFLFWVVLNGRLSLEIAFLGAAVTAFSMVFLCLGCDWSLKKEGNLYRLLPQILIFIFIVIWEIAKANWNMGKIVWSGKKDPVVRHLHTSLKTKFGRMVLSNCITLTPGTITLSCKGDELSVHCINERMAQELTDTVFERKLRKMEEILHG